MIPVAVRRGYSTGLARVPGQRYELKGWPSMMISTRRSPSFGTTRILSPEAWGFAAAQHSKNEVASMTARAAASVGMRMLRLCLLLEGYWHFSRLRKDATKERKRHSSGAEESV